MFDAQAFAEEWVAAWNARDLERVLRHYGDDVEFISPTAAVVVPSSGGVIKGKHALREYWAAALPKNPALHFELLEVLDTVTGACVLYRNHHGQTVAETMLVDDLGLVIRGVAAYGPRPV